MTLDTPTMRVKPLAFIIEDDEYLGEIFSEVLRGANMEPRVIPDGEKAMLMLARITPVLIVLDLNLPKYSGANVFAYIRNTTRLRDIWIILTTADAAQAAELNRMDEHNLLTLIKPVSVDQLEQLVLKVMNLR
jgi:DNA-binding response OmpR family regulator